MAFATWFSLVLKLPDYKLPVIGQLKSDRFGVTIAKLNYKYGLLRTNQIQEFVIDTIILSVVMT